jgi:hypothetical protein
MYLNVLDKEGQLLAKSAGITFVVAGQAAMRGHLAQQQGNYVLAKKHFKEALVIYRVYTSPTYTAWCLEGLASTIYAEGHYKPAARLYAAAAVLRKRDQTPLPTSENEAFLQVVDNLRTALDERDFGEEWATGSSFTQDEAINDAILAAGG